MEALTFDQRLAIAAIILGALFFLIGLGATLAMDARTKGEFRFAVGCFILSASMLCFTVGVWNVTTESSWYQRVFISGVCFALIGILSVEGIRWTHSRHRRASSKETAKSPASGTTEKPKVLDAEATPPKIPSRGPTHNKPPKPPEKPPTLDALFSQDLSYTMKFTLDDLGIKFMDGTVIPIKRQVYLDFQAKSKFVGFYVPVLNPPNSEHNFSACLDLAGLVEKTMIDVSQRTKVSAGYSDEQTSMQDLTFSGRVLIYHQDFLSIVQKADIVKEFKAKNFDVQFRGPDYLGNKIIDWDRQHDKH